MSHDPRHDPLDEHERSLARVVRALPGGEPPPALDLRILKAAQDAVANAPRKPRRTLAATWGWGMGTAAAAVLAVGVSWPLLKGSLPASRPAPAAVAVQAEAEEKERLTVDLVEREPLVYDNSPPPAKAAKPAAEPPRQRAAAAPAPVADALPEAFTDEHVDHDAVAGGDAPPGRSDNATAALGAAASADLAMAPPPPPPPPAPAAPVAPASAPAPAVTAQALAKSESAAASAREQRAELDQVEVTGSRIKRTGGEAKDYERIKADQRLAPAAWLRRIRWRIDQGDLPGARASLALFRETHPREAVPEAIVQSLRE